MARADLGQHLAARGDRLRLERLGMGAGEDLARDHSLDQPLHRQRSHQRQRAPRVEAGEEPPRIGALLVAMEAVAHAVLHLFHGDGRLRPQLQRAFADGGGGAVGIAQLDAAARAHRELAPDLHADAEPRFQLLCLPLRAEVGGVALREDGVAARVDHLAGHSVRLAHGGDADRHALLRPLLLRPGEALLVVVAELLQLHPGGAHARRALEELQGPAALRPAVDRGDGFARRGTGKNGERPLRAQRRSAAALPATRTVMSGSPSSKETRRDQSSSSGSSGAGAPVKSGSSARTACESRAPPRKERNRRRGVFICAGASAPRSRGRRRAAAWRAARACRRRPCAPARRAIRGRRGW